MVNCRKINEQTLDSETRVDDFINAAPDCICESQKTSRASPGIVAKEEVLSRFIFHPVHLNRRGEIKSAAYGHVFTKGCSIQREDKASSNELAYFIKCKYLPRSPEHTWNKLTQATCEIIRRLRLSGSTQQLFCVYDTSEKDNPAHAEIFTAKKLDDAGEQNEARSLIYDVFHNGSGANGFIKPEIYRNGEVLRATALPQEQLSIFMQRTLREKAISFGVFLLDETKRIAKRLLNL